MNAKEFSEQFWPHFAVRFPSVASWIAGLDIDTDPTQGAVMALWRTTLDDVTVDEAKTSADSIYREEREPSQWGSFPAMIRNEAVRSRGAPTPAWKPPKVVDGEPVYKCRLCLDVGLLTVWRPEAHKSARNDPDAFVEYGRNAGTCAVPCKCHEGQKLRHLGPLFSADRMVISGMANKDERKHLVEVLAARDASRPRRQASIPLTPSSGGYDFGDYSETIT